MSGITRLEGGILEALGRLFKNDVHIFVYPQKDPETGALWTVDTLEVPRDVRHLYGYLVERGFLIPVEDYDKSVLDIQAPEVLEKLQSGDEAWESMVDERVAEVIKARKLFGYGARWPSGEGKSAAKRRDAHEVDSRKAKQGLMAS